MKEKLLELKKICKSFSIVQVLFDISVDFYAGEVHCLLGENGAGKSTLIKIISGAFTADSGDVLYLGEKVMNNNPRWARTHGINSIYQEIDIIPTLSAAENIFLGNEFLTKTGNINWKLTNEKAKELLNSIEADFDVTIPVSMLPLPQQQVVAIAKALSQKANVIIFDEPTAVFSSKETEVLFNIINKLKAQGKAIIYISHHIEEIFEIGDKITVLRDGHHIKTGLISEFTKETLINHMVGRDVDLSKREFIEDYGKEVLRLEDISRSGIVQDINLSIREGEILGIAGLVGSGRTELAQLIIGLRKPDTGEILFKGKKIKKNSPGKAYKFGIGLLPKDRKNQGLVAIRPVGENIAYSLISKKFRTFINWSFVKKATKSLIEEVGVKPPNEKTQVTFLSGGNQQKVVFGKLLGANCDLLILDEPTRGVDVGAREEIYSLMQRLKKENTAIIMISSDLTEILSQSDRILVMAKGRIVGEIPAKEATEEAVLACALSLGEGNNGIEEKLQ